MSRERIAMQFGRVLVLTLLINAWGIAGYLNAVYTWDQDAPRHPVSINNKPKLNTVEDVVSAKPAKSADWVSKVHIISMNHLDVGYNGIPGQQTGFINNVLHYYFHEYFPRAVKLGNDLRRGGYVETFTYTTHPWLVSMYMDCPPNWILAGIRLRCPNATARAEFAAGVRDGFITWHAAPMNLQPEFSPSPTLFDLALDISSQLDRRFGVKRKTRVMSQRDVPGMTKSVIPVLAGRGITGVSVGVNNMSPPPALPKLFRWVNNGSEVMGTWHPGGYPDPPGPSPSQPGGISLDDCVVLANFSDALCFAFRSDNQGPPADVREILNYYEILRAQFPNAELAASTLENYFSAAESIRGRLPVVEKEIGDTWIQGDASDPRKCAVVRAIGRALTACLDSGRCDPDERRVWNATRLFAKAFEHTWGLSTEVDEVHWSNAAFASRRRSEKVFEKCERSWVEQRAVYAYAIEALENHPVVADIKEELAQLAPSAPDLSDYRVVDKTARFVCPGDLAMQFGADGALVRLSNNGTDWASPESRLARFVYQTYNESDFDAFAAEYSWRNANVGINKINLTLYAHPESKTWPVNLVTLYQRNSGVCDFHVQLEMVEKEAWVSYGAPQSLWIQYDYSAQKRDKLDITLQIFNKTVTRLPESLSLFFHPLPAASGSPVRLSKLGGVVDPLDVILNGSQYQHALDEGGMTCGGGAGRMRVSSADVPVVIMSTHADPLHSAFPTPLTPITDTIGAGFNIYNNIWGTNWIFWYPYLAGDENFKARFTVQFEAGRV